MKKILFSMLLLFVSFFNSCRKNDYTPVDNENCRVLKTTVSGSTSYSTTFTYDDKGFISNEQNEIGNSKIEYRYHRKDNGQIESADVYYSGKFDSKLKYSYIDGRVVKLEHFIDDFSTGLSYQIKYNGSGLITEIFEDYADFPEYGRKSFFEYDAQGLIIKTSKADMNGNITSYNIYENHGKTSKSSDSYLIDHGLPFQLVFAYAYSNVDAGEGTVMEMYSADATGAMVIKDRLITKSKTLNSKGYTQSIVYTNESGKEVQKLEYQFDCSKNGKFQ